MRRVGGAAAHALLVTTRVGLERSDSLPRVTTGSATKKAPLWGRYFFVAEPVGFEPTVGSTPTQLFESCTFGRSDTVPGKSLVHGAGVVIQGAKATIDRGSQ